MADPKSMTLTPLIRKEIVDQLSADRGAAIEGMLEPVKIEIAHESVFEEPFTETIGT